MIELQPIEGSSQVEAAGYDDAKQNLHVRYKNGDATYVYKDVGVDVAKGFFGADSPGRYLTSVVKAGYSFEKIPDSEEGGEA